MTFFKVSIISPLNLLYFKIGRFQYFNLSVLNKFLIFCTNSFACFCTFLISSISLFLYRYHTLNAYSKPERLLIKLLCNLLT